MPPKSWSFSLFALFFAVPASFAQTAEPSSNLISQFEIKPAIIWCISAFALILSIAAFFVPPARRAMISTIALGALAAAGIWKNWHVGVFDLLSGAATFSASADVIKGLILAGALVLAVLFLLSAYLLVLTWGRGGYVLMGIVSVFGVWGILAHTEILPNTMIWAALPNKMGSLGFLLSAGSTLGFVLSGLVIAFGGGTSSKPNSEDETVEINESKPSPPNTPSTPAEPPSALKPKVADTPPPATIPKPTLQASTAPSPPLSAKPSQSAEPSPASKPKETNTPPAVSIPKPALQASTAPSPPPTAATIPAAVTPTPAAKPDFGVVSAKPVRPAPALVSAPSKSSATKVLPEKLEKRAGQIAVPAPLPPEPKIPVSVASEPPQKPAVAKPAPAVPNTSSPVASLSAAPLHSQPSQVEHLRKHQQDRIRSKSTPKPIPTTSPAAIKSGVDKPVVLAAAAASSGSTVAPELERSKNKNSGQESISWKMKNGVWSRG